MRLLNTIRRNALAALRSVHINPVERDGKSWMFTIAMIGIFADLVTVLRLGRLAADWRGEAMFGRGKVAKILERWEPK